MNTTTHFLACAKVGSCSRASVSTHPARPLQLAALLLDASEASCRCQCASQTWLPAATEGDASPLVELPQNQTQNLPCHQSVHAHSIPHTVPHSPWEVHRPLPASSARLPLGEPLTSSSPLFCAPCLASSTWHSSGDSPCAVCTANHHCCREWSTVCREGVQPQDL